MENELNFDDYRGFCEWLEENGYADKEYDSKEECDDGRCLVAAYYKHKEDNHYIFTTYVEHHEWGAEYFTVNTTPLKQTQRTIVVNHYIPVEEESI